MKYIDNIYLINLDKDVSRYKKTLLECKKISNKQPIRISGIYGKDLSQQEIFNNTDYIYSKIGLKSAIGCAMSHIKAWETMIKNNDNSALFVEDDALIDNDFKTKIENINIPDDYYIIYLGCVLGCDINKKYNMEFPFGKLILGPSKKVIKINENVFVPSLPLALHGYILSKKGAEYLLNEMKKDKIQSHIDAQILKYIYKVPSYSVSPQLIYQQDVDLESSNNIASQYPIILNKFLDIRDSNGIPFNYKVNIGVYQIGDYIVNFITVVIIMIGLITGFNKINIKYILSIFTIFALIEMVEMKKINKQIVEKTFITNLSVSLVLILTFHYFSSIFLPSLTNIIK